jgi:hypothetical protein
MKVISYIQNGGKNATLSHRTAEVIIFFYGIAHRVRVLFAA